MKKIIAIAFIVLLLVGVGFLLNSRYHVFKGHTLGNSENAQKETYYCPMHPNFISDKPGSCAICGMSLVKKEHEEHRVIKDEAGGMDTGVYISPEKQQLIGVVKEKIQKRKLIREILTVGKVAYDPDLYVAQEEYIQALKTAKMTKNSVLASVSQQSNSLLAASEKKLLLLGMSKKQIEELAQKGAAQSNLYLPMGEDLVWVYITIYEYEMGLIKEGLPVKITAVAFPGEEFSGEITAITPVLDPMTRSVQVRSEVKDPEHKLKPEMFVNVKIDVDLGEKLAVSQEAVINTGKQTLVVVANDGGKFLSREVKLGQKAEGFYEVLDGLKDGEEIVTSGNFLIDSESRLQSAISGGSEHKHGQ